MFTPITPLRQVEDRLRALEEILKDQEASADRLKGATEALQTELMEVGKAIYSGGSGGSGGAQPPPPGGGGGAGSDTDTPIDADFKDADKP